MDPATPPSALLPVAVRRFGDRIAVTGAAADLSGIAPGTELVAIDGVPARAAYDRVAAQISASTEGLRAHLAAIYLGERRARRAAPRPAARPRWRRPRARAAAGAPRAL